MKKNNYKYIVHIFWSTEDKTYVAQVPELPGCATHGKTYEQASKNINDAIETWLEGAEEAGYPIPEPFANLKFSGKLVTHIDPELHRSLSLQAKVQGKSLNCFVEELLERSLMRKQSLKDMNY